MKPRSPNKYEADTIKHQEVGDERSDDTSVRRRHPNKPPDAETFGNAVQKVKRGHGSGDLAWREYITANYCLC